MAQIKIEARKLSVVEKCAKGDTIIEKSADNPRVPGNAEPLAQFAEANAALAEAKAAVMAAQTTLAEVLSRQEAAVQRWVETANALASFTESATCGDAGCMLSAGFEVRAARSPSHRPEAPTHVSVKIDGRPGYSRLRWKPLRDAVMYLIEGTDDPAALEGWTPTAMSTKASATINGATPGRERWFRIAAVNAAGQGPWSGPALRAVK